MDKNQTNQSNISSAEKIALKNIEEANEDKLVDIVMQKILQIK